MKLLRPLIVTSVAACIVLSGIAVAQARRPASDPPGSDKRAITVAPTLVAPTATVSASTSSSSTTTAPIDSGRVIVLLKDSAAPAVLESVARSAETSTGGARPLAHGNVDWRVPKGRSARTFAAQLEKNSHVEYAVPDYIRQPVGYLLPAYDGGPNDPDFLKSTDGESYFITSSGGHVVTNKYPYGRSWWLRDVNAPEAWSQGYTGAAIAGKFPLRASGSDVTVAVLDSGLFAGHGDVGANVTRGHDFFDHETIVGGQKVLVADDDVTPLNPNYDFPSSYYSYDEAVMTASHGTCVAGEIAATGNNSIGTIGVGYDTHVVVHKVLGKYWDGTIGVDDLATMEAIRYSADHGARVISMSFGAYSYSKALADAINYAYAKGCVIVAAKGNDGSSQAFYPASNAHVISVGALDKNAQGVTIPADYTNYAKTSLDLFAPGTFIWGLTIPSGFPDEPDPTRPGYDLWEGTSMAAPVVSGAVAWLWRAAPLLSNAEITNEVLNSAAPKGYVSRFKSGYRELDMNAAYDRLKADFPLLTRPAIADQTVAAIGGSVPLNWGVMVSPQRGVTYVPTIDGAVQPGTAAALETLQLGEGTHTVVVQAHSGYNWDDGSAIATGVITVVAPASGASTWQGFYQSATTPSRGQAVSISGAVRDASGTALSGAPVRLQSSANGSGFADVAGAPVSNLPNGVYLTSVAPSSRTYYRFAFADSGAVTGSISPVALVVPQVSLSTPSSKSTASRKVKLSVTGTLRPAHRSSSRTVKLKIERWNGHRWAAYHTVWTRVTKRNSSYSTYSVKVRLRKGRFRLHADAPADSLHSTTHSGYKTVTIK